MDAHLANLLLSQPAFHAYLELTRPKLINAASAPVNAKPVLMQPLVKPVKWVMSFQARVAFRFVLSLVLHVMLLVDV